MSDLKLENGDLVLDNINNDLAIHLLKEHSVLHNLARRIKTSKPQYMIYTYNKDTDASVLIDTNYGTNLLTLAAYPSNSIVNVIKEQVLTSIQEERRITLNSIQVSPLSEYSVSIIIDYSYNGSKYKLEV